MGQEEGNDGRAREASGEGGLRRGGTRTPRGRMGIHRTPEWEHGRTSGSGSFEYQCISPCSACGVDVARERTRVLGQRGGSLGITIPPVILKALDLKAGDRLEVRLRSTIIEVARVENSRPET